MSNKISAVNPNPFIHILSDEGNNRCKLWVSALTGMAMAQSESHDHQRDFLGAMVCTCAILVADMIEEGEDDRLVADFAACLKYTREERDNMMDTH